MAPTHDASALPAHTLQTLTGLCKHLGIVTSIARHKPTFSAAETQRVLPEGCLVQKSVTGGVGGKIVLWTGVGDFHVAKALRKAANRKLGLAASRGHTLNPREVDALQFYNMQPGMVSPFLVKESPAARELAALFVLDWTETYDLSLLVAISLSLTESLIIKLVHLDALLHAYAAKVYTHVPLIKVSEERLARDA